MLSRFIAKVEALPISFGEWSAAFLGIIFIRFFLENISSPTPSFPAVPDTLTLVHYGVFYLAAILLFALVLRVFIKDILLVTKVLLFIFPIIWLPPIVDFIISRGAGSGMAYIFTASSGLLASFFTLGGPYVLGGITLGIKIELICILVGIFGYVFIKTKQVGRAIFAAMLMYCAIFFLLALPSFLAFGSPSPLSSLLSVFSGSHMPNNFLRPTIQLSYGYAIETLFNLGMAHFLYLFDFALIVAWLSFYERNTARAIFKNMRLERIALFLGLIILGAGFASYRHGVSFFGSAYDVVTFVELAVAWVCAWMFAVGVNDVADVAIDTISNNNRPLITGAISVAKIKQQNTFFLLWSLLGGYLAGYWGFFAIATFTAAYYIYSAHPLRLKQVPVIAPFLISLACLSAVLAGYYFVSPTKVFVDFPLNVLLLVIIFFTLFANFKDIKDIEGDRAAGIQTIPVIFGAHGKEVVGALFAIAFLSVPIILGKTILLVPSLIAAVIGYVAINRRAYREWRIFVLYFAYVVVFVWLLA
jgi:4-hydroxybenzoate polyprenyltransferase